MSTQFLRRRRLLAGISAYSLALPLLARASQGAPGTPPIRLIVPFPPGGTTDFMARLLSEKMQETTGRNLIVENKGGAGGMIGTEMVARAPADGTTLLLPSSAQLALAPSLFPEVRYDPVRDFAPITLIGATPNVLLAHPSLAVKGLPDLIDLCRKKSSPLAFASPGSGSTAALAMDLLQMEAGIKLMQVPYRGAGPAVIDAISGRVPLIAVAITSVVQHAKNGSLRALAVTGAKRCTILPDVPTFAETLPGFEASAWYGIAAPAGTPQTVVQTLNKQLVAIIESEDVRRAYAARGIDAESCSPAKFTTYIKSELIKWKRVIERSGARVG